MRIHEMRGMNAPPYQQFGIEVEYENARAMPDGMPENWWEVTRDGSLREGGREWRTFPLDYDTSMRALTWLWDVAAQLRYQGSIRTGIHIHADMALYTPAQVGGVIAAYLCVEPVLFDLCGPEREECIYCVPWYRAGSDVDAVRRFLENPSQGWTGLADTCKYSAFYLEPMHRFGTVEFRAAPTFSNLSDVKRWLTVVRDIVAYGTSRGSAAEVVEDFEASELSAGERALPGVFNGALHAALMNEVDSIGVAAGLVRTNPEENWSFDGTTEAPSDEQRMYWQMAGAAPRYAEGAHRLHIDLPRDPFPEVEDDDESYETEEFDNDEEIG